jgi:hypothetical protein
MNPTRTLLQCVACILAAISAAPAIAASDPVALELVALTKLQEREAEAIGFMIKVSPLRLPPGTKQCMLSRAGPTFDAYFANVFSSNFSALELQQAVAFFRSTEGVSAVAARRAHEKSMVEAAAQRRPVESEHTSYPPVVQRALDEFGKTAAGAKFDLTHLEPAAAAMTGTSAEDLRSRLLSECLQGS